MPEASGTALLRLMACLSPAFPVGSFSYSHGLERAVEDGRVADAGELDDWLGELLDHGSLRNDLILLAESTRRAATGGDLADIAELAEALAGSAERHLEATLQGAAFIAAAATWPSPEASLLPAQCPYCVAVGAHAGAWGLDAAATASAFAQAAISNQLQAAIRLGVIGQTQALRLLASFEPALIDAGERAARSSLDDLGSSALVAEMAAMRHETQYSRLFRT